jgi:hypothetical protein
MSSTMRTSFWALFRVMCGLEGNKTNPPDNFWSPEV